jgi:AraC-like DNA-binding protein
MQDFFEYFPCGPSELAWGFHVSAAGCTRIKAGKPYPPPHHPDSHAFDWSQGRTLASLQVVYLSGGAGTFEARNEGTRTVKEGNAFILQPGVWHRYRPLAKAGWSEHWFELSGRQVTDWLSHLDPLMNVVKVSDPQEIVRQFQKLHTLCQRKPRGGRLQAATCALGILSQLLADSAQDERTVQDGLIQNAVRLMTASLREPVRMQKIACGLGVSYPTLHRHFQAETGLSPKQYLEQVRLARAAELLSASRLSIKEIAAMLGYSSAFHFSRHFKMVRGTSPSIWREDVLAGTR